MKPILFSFIFLTLFDLSAQTESNAVVENELLIVGSNIWVRSEPTIGEVVMKLNDRDRCKVLDQGRFEYIRGTAHYWYQIVFEADTGWVFGSQTNRSAGVAMLSAVGKDELWEEFKTRQIQKCKTESKAEDAECVVNGFNMINRNNKLAENQLMLHYQREGRSSHQYRVSQKFGDQLFIIDELVAQSGAAGISQSENFYIAFKNPQGYKLPNQFFKGKPIELINKNSDQYFLITFKEIRNVLMFYTSHYNIYLVNAKTETIQLIAEQIGRVVRQGMMDDIELGSSYIHKSSIEFDRSTLGFKLLAYPKLRTTDGWEEISDPRISEYHWDPKKRRFSLN